MYGWAIKNKKSLGKNLTLPFQKLAKQSNKGNFEEFPHNAREFIYLLIPGLFTNIFGVRYMKDNIEKMQKLSLDVRKLPIDTGANVEVNAKYIKNYILNERKNKSIIIIGHSKGGVDAATAISKYDLYDYIKAVILLQAPWGGTPLADEVDSYILGSLHNIMASITNADKNAIRDLNYEERQRMINKYPFNTKRVTTICLSSVIGGKISMLYLLGAFLERKYNMVNDGILGPEDALISGCDYVNLYNMEHGGTVFLLNKRNGSDLYPGDIMYALIVLAINNKL